MKDIRFNRERFDKGKNFYAPKGIVPQTSVLRVEVPFEAGKGLYVFDIHKAVKRVTERVLQRNDLFVVRGVDVGTMVEDTDFPGHYPVLSYPPVVGAGAGAIVLAGGLKGFVSGNIFALYNGSLSLKTDTTVNYSTFPLDSFLQIPQTQATAALLPQLDKEKSVYELPEEIALSGGRDHEIKIEFPSTPDSNFAGEAGTVSYLVLQFYGWNFPGGANDRYKVDGNPYKDVL